MREEAARLHHGLRKRRERMPRKKHRRKEAPDECALKQPLRDGRLLRDVQRLSPLRSFARTRTSVTMTHDPDFGALRPTSQVKSAAAVMGVAGFLYLLLALQTNSMLRSGGIYWVVVPTMFLLGGGMAYCSVQLARMRAWASKVGMLVAALAALLGLVWLVFTAMNSIFSLMAMIVIPASVVAAALARSTRAATSAAEIARERLEDAGLDAGF